MSGRLRRFVAVWCVALAGTGSCAGFLSAGSARADGDPGSDVLVYQDLFAGAAAQLSIPQQIELQKLLGSARSAGVPIRVAVIGGPSDLGVVTALWLRPGPYARFLGLELSAAYGGRLLVVMPNGIGFNWPGHASAAIDARLTKIRGGSGGAGLLAASEAAVRTLAAAAGVTLAAPAGQIGATSVSAGTSTRVSAKTGSAEGGPVIIKRGAASAGSTSSTGGGRHTDDLVALVALLVIVLGVGGYVARSRLPALTQRRLLPAAAVAAAVAVLAIVLATSGSSPAPRSQSQLLAANPGIDPGTPISQPAPAFTLTDQFGRPASLSQYRGKVVILAFNDSECTTVCPLTTEAMRQAKAMLGPAGSGVQLLGVDANPHAISLEDVQSYSELHGMVHAWRFLTGSLPQLRRVWSAYKVEAAVQGGEIEHTPALFMIDPQGRERRVYVTQASYASIDQFAQVLATAASSLLPGRPAVDSRLSYAHVQPIAPTDTVILPRSGGGSVTIGPGKSHLYVFFATWDQEVTSLAGHLDGLNAYAAGATQRGLPDVTAIDEASVEPSPDAVSAFLRGLPSPLRYPVAVDTTGRVADGYEVQGAPWYVLTSADGKILWYWEVDTSGWLTATALAEQVRAALSKSTQTPTSPAAVAQALRGSPAALAALHAAADNVLGGEPALLARIKALHGYPIVLNAWASWCPPCQAEFGLFASAAARFGRRVAFIGADTNDSAAAAQSFLAQHPVSYPSYEATTGQLAGLGIVFDLPTTIFINSTGKVEFIHTGQYDSQGTLDQDISSYASGR